MSMNVMIVPLLSTVIAASPADLGVVRYDPDPAPAGGSTTVHALVSNEGPHTAGDFTVTVRAPHGSHVSGPYFPANCQPDTTATEVVCAFPAGLPRYRSATALVPLKLDRGVSGVLSGGRITVRGKDDPNPRNNSLSFTVRVSG